MAFPNLNQSHSGQGRTLLGNMVNGQQDSRIMSPGAGGSGGQFVPYVELFSFFFKD